MDENNHKDIMYAILKKDVGITYIFLMLTGLFGGHRYYLGKIGTGVLYTFTLGCLGIGWIFDLFTLGRQVRRYNADLRSSLENGKLPN